jgi:Ca2+-binding RTX toxin-like protein
VYWRWVIVTAVALIAVPSAFGSTASVEDHVLEYVAAPGEGNAVDVSEQGQTVTIIDTGAVITAQTGCSQVNDHEVTCSEVAQAGIFLSDLGDVASLLLVDSVSFVFRGQVGDDDFSLCLQCSGTLEGGPGDDTLRAGDVGSTLRGGIGVDTLAGGAGVDLLFGVRGSDTIDGADGADQIYPGGGHDALDGGAGRDRLFFARNRTGIVVDLQLGTATGQGTKTIVEIEVVQGTPNRDELYGDAGGNALFGDGGNDLLVARGGEDLLFGGVGRGKDGLSGGGGPDRLFGDGGPDLLVGGVGNDRLKGGGGKDRMFGYAGDDRFRARDGFRDFVRGNAGDDSARIDVALDALRSIETLF